MSDQMTVTVEVAVNLPRGRTKITPPSPTAVEDAREAAARFFS